MEYQELREVADIEDYRLCVYYVRYSGFRYEISKARQYWYNKRWYGSEQEASKAGKAKIKSLIKKAKVEV